MDMSKRILLSTVFFAVPLALAGCSNNEGQVSGSMGATEFSAASSGAHELGVVHFQAGNFGLAIQHFQTATTRDPRSVESWNGLAAGYDKVGRFDLAERYYKRALVIEPQSAQTLNNLGYSYWLQTRYDLALAFLREADQLDGGNRVISANRKLASQSLQAAEGNRNGAAVAASGTAHPLLKGDTTPFRPRVERSGEGEQALITQLPDRAPVVQPEPAPAPEAMPPEITELGPEAMPAVPLQPVQAAMLGDDDIPARPEVEAASTARATQADLAPARGSRPPMALLAGLDEAATTTIPYLEQGSASAILGAPVSLVDNLDAPILVVSRPSESSPVTTEPRVLTAALVQYSATAEPRRRDEQTMAVRPPRALTVALERYAAEAEPRQQFAQKRAAKPPRELTAKLTEYAAALEGLTAGNVPDAGLPSAERLMARAEPGVTGKKDSYKSSTSVYRGPLIAQAPSIEISNGAGREGMANRLEQFISTRGLATARLTNTDTSARTQTTIYYGKGWQVYAMGLASMLPVEVSLAVADEVDADIRIEIGDDLARFDRALIADLGMEDDPSG
jgi:hypothetical protein